MQLFGSSGIRAIADRDLLQLSFKVGLAVGKIYHNVVVGSDTRTSGDALKHAVISGLLSAGARCSDIGIAPTPTLAYAARQFDAGIMITASHNPPEYNGMKLFNPDGSGFDAKQQRQIEKLVSDDSLAIAPWIEIKSSIPYPGAVEEHIERILRDFKMPLKLKVVVDAGCGAAALVTPHLLRRMGCEVVTLDCYPSGFFPHAIEPVEANLGNLIKATLQFGAGLGIAHDGDADRMMAVDERGQFIAGDKLLVILAEAARARKVVTTVDCSMAVEERKFSVSRTRVGDSFVSDSLKKSGDFGGEPSGAWIFPKVSLCPDGIYAAAWMASIAESRRISSLCKGIPCYPLMRGSVPSGGKNAAWLEARLKCLKPLSIDRTDGLKLTFKDGWLLARVSGTEPKIRLTAEARTEARLRRLYESGLKALTE